MNLLSQDDAVHPTTLLKCHLSLNEREERAFMHRCRGGGGAAPVCNATVLTLALRWCSDKRMGTGRCGTIPRMAVLGVWTSVGGRH